MSCCRPHRFLVYQSSSAAISQPFQPQSVSKEGGAPGEETKRPSFFHAILAVGSDHYDKLRSVGAALGLVSVEVESNLGRHIAEVKASSSQLEHSAEQHRLKSAEQHRLKSAEQHRLESAERHMFEYSALLQARLAELGPLTIKVDGCPLLLVEPIKTVTQVDQWMPDIVINRCRELLALELEEKGKQSFI